jgi:multiple sugar transport system substrate-binding protein
MKKYLSLAVAFILIASLLVACGTPAGPSDTTPTPAPAPETPNTPAPPVVVPGDTPPEPVEIRASWWGDTGRHELYGSIIDLFTAEFPHITVIQEPASWADYWDRLTIQAGGNNAPDFMGMHPQFVTDYAPRGVLASLQPFVDGGVIDLSGWEQSVINTGIVDNNLVMLSMGITFSSTFINAGLFNDLGVPLPAFDWTWSDLKDLGLQVRDAFDSRGERHSWIYQDSSGAFQLFRQWVRQNGRELYQPNGDIGFTVEDAESWFDLWKDLRDLNLVPDAATTAEYTGATLEDSLFSRGHILGVSVPVNQFNLYNNTFPDRVLSIIRNPVNPRGAPGELVEGAHFAVSGQSTPEKQLAAAQLLNFWLNSPEALALFRLDQGVPGNLALSWAYMDDLNPAQAAQELVAEATAIRAAAG